MARIRSIKPEFWTSEQVVSCTLTARLLFIGIWTFCDDNGIHPASVTRLKLQIFPADSISTTDLQGLINELVHAGLLTEYQAGNDRYWQVTGWSKHQRIDKPTYRHPAPSEEKQIVGVNSPNPNSGTECKPVIPDIPQLLDDNSTNTRRELGTSSATERSGVENTMSDKSDCITVLNYLNSITDSRFRSVPANLKLIAARLKEGATLEDCKSVIDAKVTEWIADAKMTKYLRPETLFNATKFAQYVGETGNQPKGQQWE